MHISRKYVLCGAMVSLMAAGVAEAATAKLHTMHLDAPDGEMVEVHYTGDVAPQVRIVPASAQSVAMTDPFAQMDRISAMMDAQMQAMMQRTALLQRQALSMQQAVQTSGAVPGMTMASAVPPGTHVTYYSSSTDAQGCTRSVSYSSDGSRKQPKLTQAASDGCEAAPNSSLVQAKAEAPAQTKAPGTSA